MAVSPGPCARWSSDLVPFLAVWRAFLRAEQWRLSSPLSNSSLANTGPHRGLGVHTDTNVSQRQTLRHCATKRCERVATGSDPDTLKQDWANSNAMQPDVHHTRKRGKALQPALMELLVMEDPGNQYERTRLVVSQCALSLPSLTRHDPKSDHTTLAHWQLALAHNIGVLGSSSVRIACGLI